ncbi:MAG: cytochrome c5 family protein [gamma proteobacterium symbiont of Ctena orbiculata]|nr:MAG: cytochrome c5 family protein [gamma proteobacterium symbiont of Ctena orbiculata]
MSQLWLIFICLYLLAGCSEQQQGQAIPDMPRFAEQQLAKGRGIWMGTCRNCHLLGVSGEPAVTDSDAWAQRIGKGKPALYQSALNGIKGDDGNYRMPPRGGNGRLKDEEIRQAVDYMVAAVETLSSSN